MRKLILLAILIACAAPAAFAQTTTTTRDYPSMEFFAGYSHARVDNSEDASDIDVGFPGTVTSTSDFFNNQRVGFNGFETSLTGNVNRWFGIKGDFSGHYKKEDASVTFTPTGGPAVTQNFRINARVYNALGGPEIKFRNTSAVTPWAHALFGIAHANIKVDTVGSAPLGNLSDNVSDNGFAMAFGGGLDFRASNHVSVRASADYNPTFLGDNTISGSNNNRQDNFRLSIGLLFH